jgi:hypothetical protein
MDTKGIHEKKKAHAASFPMSVKGLVFHCSSVGGRVKTSLRESAFHFFMTRFTFSAVHPQTMAVSYMDLFST